MAQAAAAAEDVHDVLVEPERPGGGDAHRGEGLVDLPEGDVAGRQAGLLCGPACSASRPAGGRSPADPLFDPFWAIAAEAGVPVVFHVSNSGYQHFYGTHCAENPDTALGVAIHRVLETLYPQRIRQSPNK